VADGVESGTIHDIGYHGLLAEIAGPVELYDEFMLSIDLLQVEHEARDVYARVVKVMRRGGAFLAGLEFTSLSALSNEKIQMFVHHALQSEERR
jgi:hypothetical protein